MRPEINADGKARSPTITESLPSACHFGRARRRSLRAVRPAATRADPVHGTYILDIRDLDNPRLVERFTDGTVGLDHNFVVKDDKLYIASYTSGTRVLRIQRDANGTVGLRPLAHMDTEPRLQENILNINQEEKFGTAFLGQWGIYPLFDSGTIIASDRNNGLIVMRLSDAPCMGMKCSR